MPCTYLTFNSRFNLKIISIPVHLCIVTDKHKVFEVFKNIITPLVPIYQYSN